MNRFKKEALREQKARELALSKLPEDERKTLLINELKDELKRKLSERLRLELFSEELDFMCDSNADIRDRKQGKFPFKEEYIERFQTKRKALGIEPLSVEGHDPIGSSQTFCNDLVEKIVGDNILEALLEKHLSLNSAH